MTLFEMFDWYVSRVLKVKPIWFNEYVKSNSKAKTTFENKSKYDFNNNHGISIKSKYDVWK